MAGHPVSRRALDPPAYARGWFATRRTVGLRQALNDGVGAISVPTKEAAQKQADTLMKPYIEQMALKLPD